LRKLTTLLLLLLTTSFCWAQERPLFEPTDSLDKKRLVGVGVTTAVIWTGSMVGLDRLWYADFDREGFHFYNDNAEWKGMDKIGHAWTSYHGGRLGHGLLIWSGVEDDKAEKFGAPLGLAFMTGVEVLDGFSSGWGFSTGDMLSNVAGTSLFYIQQRVWDEQRIGIKLGYEGVDYLNDPLVQDRVNDIYGTGAGKLLSDYNSQTMWLTVNPASFAATNSSFPKWINVAVGYSADGLLGGRFNYWCSDTDIAPEDCPLAQQIDFSYLPRGSQFFLSPDIDFSKINSESAFVRTLLSSLNMVKFPAPALEINADGDLKLRALR